MLGAWIVLILFVLISFRSAWQIAVRFIDLLVRCNILRTLRVAWNLVSELSALVTAACRCACWGGASVMGSSFPVDSVTVESVEVVDRCVC